MKRSLNAVILSLLFCGCLAAPTQGSSSLSLKAGSPTESRPCQDGGSCAGYSCGDGGACMCAVLLLEDGEEKRRCVDP